MNVRAGAKGEYSDWEMEHVPWGRSFGGGGGGNGNAFVCDDDVEVEDIEEVVDDKDEDEEYGGDAGSTEDRKA